MELCQVTVVAMEMCRGAVAMELGLVVRGSLKQLVQIQLCRRGH